MSNSAGAPETASSVTAISVRLSATPILCSMYLAYSSSASFGLSDVWTWVMHAVTALLHFIVHAAHITADWLARSIPSLLLCLRQLFERPSEWTVHAAYACYAFFHTHPHIAHLLCWSIFFGPLIVLVPCLLLHEITFLVLFNLSFVTHGLIPGTLDEQYSSLKETFMDHREPLFYSVESAMARYNKCTTEHVPVMVVRVIAGMLGAYVLYGIWSGW